MQSWKKELKLLFPAQAPCRSCEVKKYMKFCPCGHVVICGECFSKIPLKWCLGYQLLIRVPRWHLHQKGNHSRLRLQRSKRSKFKQWQRQVRPQCVVEEVLTTSQTVESAKVEDKKVESDSQPLEATSHQVPKV